MVGDVVSLSKPPTENMTMRRTISLAAILISACAIAGQAVRLEPHSGATDVWGKSFDAQHKITFTGKVTGIEKVRQPSGSDKEVTLLVRNHDGGGTAVVDIGTSWYVEHQVTTIHLGDRVQVTGSKAIVDGHGVILASMIVRGGRGGPVLALRRHSGKPYWIGTEVAQNPTPPTGPNVVSGTVTGLNSYVLNNVPYADAVLQTNNGLLNIDLGPQWYYGQQNITYQVGDNLSVVIGPNPITIGPGVVINNSNVIYRGSDIYNLRNGNGQPVYYWGQ